MYFCPNCSYIFDIGKSSTNIQQLPSDDKIIINKINDLFKLLDTNNTTIDFSKYKADFSKDELYKNKKFKSGVYFRFTEHFGRLNKNKHQNKHLQFAWNKYGKDSFLFTGDIDTKAEKQLVNSGENILATVLKVAHHGSKYSTSDLFLQNVKPEFAVIEVGKNTYGHPTPETLQRLENSGIKVLRTDINGDIKLISDGNNIKINN
jgi:beta-lactamase superfamily II metal-dependent hydrolase